MTPIAALVESIRVNPHDSLTVRVLADALQEAGRCRLAELVRRTGLVGPTKISHGGGGGVGYGGDGGGGYGDGGGGYGDGDGGWKEPNIISKGFTMTDGLRLFSVPSGYYPLVRVGWVTVEDFFIRVRNCRTVRWCGHGGDWGELARLGPGDDTTLLKMSDTDRFVSAVQIIDVHECDPTKWREECPEPMVEAVA